jgi:virulence factor Mce-like protein
MSRRGPASIVANPVLVGAVTTLIVVVAVYLAYNANSGLPFVPTRQINVQLGSAAQLVEGNEIREGGFRIGAVTKIRPKTLPDGRTIAVAELKLDKKVGRIPADTRISVRPRSALGLKYVQFTRGRSARSLRDGDTIPLRQTNIPVQFEDVYKIFDEPTRRASQQNLDGFGNAFTGRGVDLNTTISFLPQLFRYLEPVTRTLAQPGTQLGRFFRELGDAARIVAPVAGVNSRLFTDMAITFEAFSRDEQALKDTIQRQPGTLETGTRSFQVQRPFLSHTADFSHDLRFAVHDLRGALPVLNPALETATPVLRRTPELNAELADVFAALRDLARAPGTGEALRGLTQTVSVLNPLLRFLGPDVTVCNGWNYFWTFLGEHLSEPDTTGTSQRALLNTAPTQKDSPGDIGAAEPANGQNYDPARSGQNSIAFLHNQPYPGAINSDGTADCENGQHGYMQGPLAYGGDPKYRVVLDPHVPGSQGPTFKGRPRVPAGETFSRENQTGVKLEPWATTGIYSGSRK